MRKFYLEHANIRIKIVIGLYFREVIWFVKCYTLKSDSELNPASIKPKSWEP